MLIRMISVTIFITILLLTMTNNVEAKIISVSAGNFHVLALDSNGTVLAWGDNEYGQVGIDMSGVPVSIPQTVPIDNVKAIAAAGGDSYVLKNDGTVWGWGYNDDGRLGDGQHKSTSIPVQVKGLTDIISIAASSKNCYALRSDGTVLAWGDNRNGELGDGTTNATTTPVQVIGLEDIISLGERGTYVIKKDGTIWAWGSNIYSGEEDLKGALGDSSKPSIVTTPFEVIGVNNVINITSGELQTIYIRNDGTVWAWGSNCMGGLGDGSPLGSQSASSSIIIKNPSVQVKISDVMSVSTLFKHVVALKKDGTVWEWGSLIDRKGSKDNGGLPPTEESGIAAPVKVVNLDHIVDVSAGEYFCIALKDDGSIWGWGTNHYKELGDHKSVEPSPVLIINKISQAMPADNNQQNGLNASNNMTNTPVSDQQNNSIIPTPGMSLNTILTAVIIILGSNFVIIQLRRIK